MNNVALKLPKTQLLSELERRREVKTRKQAELDCRHGANRIRLVSYMENIGWPELFGYDMNRFLDDAGFSLEQNLRQMIFWADNVEDDSIPELSLMADAGMYWDATLFGQQIRHSETGAPEFLPHPLQYQFGLDLLGKFDFYKSGDMPKLLAKYERMKEISATEYGDKIKITFPCFHRGPLDLYVQLRGYENFLEDISDRPEKLRDALAFIVDVRSHFARARVTYLGEGTLPETSFVADDWVNIPFISPEIFRNFVVPEYARLEHDEGPVTGFHTCGNLLQVVADLLRVFPAITLLDVSPWNDLAVLDAAVRQQISFNINIKNTISLGDHDHEQLPILNTIAAIARHRRIVNVCAQAIVKLYPTYEETLARLNRFIVRSRKTLEVDP